MGMDMWFKRQDPRNSGQTLLLFTFFMIVLILFIGLGVDLGFAYITRARLSKAVDAAALTGIRAYRSDNVDGALDRARSTFQANYGTSSRDFTPPYPIDAKFDTSGPNVLLNVSATARINTFFIRVLPSLFAAGAGSWQTLPVGSFAQATRPNLILSLVLDRSTSMGSNDGMEKLKEAVPLFIDHFDDGRDRAAMSSFSYAARVDVPMAQPFRTAIKNKVSAFIADGWTCSDAGLEKGREQNLNVPIQTGEKVVKVIVFFTDGLANTFQYYPLQCNTGLGTNNIAPDSSTWDPDKDSTGTSCTFPSCLVSIVATNGCINRAFDCPEGDRSKGLYAEAEARAKAVASKARDEGSVIYSIGLGDPTNPLSKECGRPALNPDFLRSVANDPAASDFNKDQPDGLAFIALDASQLPAVFSAVADAILARLTK
jgi:Flp pilus assembly protein TadG